MRQCVLIHMACSLLYIPCCIIFLDRHMHRSCMRERERERESVCVCVCVRGKYPTSLSVYRQCFNVNKNPTRCNSMQIFIYCKVSLHVSGVTAPIVRSTKNCNRSLRYRSWYWYSYLLRPWREVAAPVSWPVPEAAVTVFSTPDDGCCDTQNM